MSYEFNEQEDRIIAGVGNRAIIITVIILLGSILDLIIILNETEGDSFWRITGFILLLVVEIVIGAVFFLPANDFRTVAKTEGNDVNELMKGLDKMQISVSVMVYALITSIILLFALMFL